MSQPGNREEYEALFAANTKIDGYFTETSMQIPCPWCAHPGFQTLSPFQGMVSDDERPGIDDQLALVHTCANCGRSGRNIIIRTEQGVDVEFVQTGGDDPPSWLVPSPRRVEWSDEMN